MAPSIRDGSEYTGWLRVYGNASSGATWQADEWIHYADSAIKPIVLKILGPDFRQAVVFRVRPEVGIAIVCHRVEIEV